LSTDGRRAQRHDGALPLAAADAELAAARRQPLLDGQQPERIVLRQLPVANADAVLGDSRRRPAGIALELDFNPAGLTANRASEAQR
jgi:hypothetical protein